MIELRGVSYRYASAAARLTFPDLVVPAGGCALIRGPSGSGKSTLLALLAGLLTPLDGVVRVGDVDVGRLSARERDGWRGRSLGFLPQRLHLSDSLSAHDNIALAPWAAGAAPAPGSIEAVLTRLGLAGLGARRPHELSVGQAQRVALARALLLRPAVLVADEPTASLDDQHGETVVRLMHELCRETGATLVVSTHDHRVPAWLGGRCQELML